MTHAGTIQFDQVVETRWDAAVIGAGPAGAVAARLLAQQGLATLLIERQTWPRRKACGGCLNGRAISLLQSIELEHVLAVSNSAPLSQLVLQANRKQVHLELTGGAAIDRMAFDAALVEAAVATGAKFLPGTTAIVEPSDHSSDVRQVRLSMHDAPSRTIETRVVLVADGLGHPSLKHISGFESRIHPTARVGLSQTLNELPQHYRMGAIYMGISPSGYVGIVRTGDGKGNLAAAVDPNAVRANGGAGNAVRSILEAAGLSSPEFLPSDSWRGTPLLTRTSSRLSAWRILLLGDAAGYSEPFTGEGIGWAIASAISAAGCAIKNLEKWELHLVQEWENHQRRQKASGQAASRLLAALLRRPMAVRLAIAALGMAPRLARPLVRQIHERAQF